MEVGLVAIFSSYVEAQPIVEFVADAGTEKDGVTQRRGLSDDINGIVERIWLEDKTHVSGDANTDVAAQIPSARRLFHHDRHRLIDHLRLRRRWLRHIGGECRCADHGGSSGADKERNA